MLPRDIIRAWKDPEYRLSLSGAERAPLPAHLARLIELADAELSAAAGGQGQCYDHSPPDESPRYDYERYANVGGGASSTNQPYECSSTAGGGSECMADVDTCYEPDTD